MSERAPVLWSPPVDAMATTKLGRFLTAHGHDDYASGWTWSVEDLGGFWSAIWDDLDVIAHTAPDTALADASMPGARWFPGSTLNYAEHALRATRGGTAVWSVSQSRPTRTRTFDELRDDVARIRAGLVRLGVGRGDRVVAYLPNIDETLAAFLAVASLGAIWASCAPEFGTRSVIDRFAQIEPTVLLAVDGYRYGTKAIDRADELAAIRSALPTLEHTVVLPYLGATVPDDALAWDDLVAESGPLAFEPVPFDHPLYILYSSGTTGLPKPIVHGHGGILLEHAKVLGLHTDLGADDRFFWFSTTGWMMWNLLVSGLLVESGVVLFDGDPMAPGPMALWEMAADLGVTAFGTSAPFVMACRKQGIEPGRDLDLSALRTVGSTGAPLPPEGFAWIYDSVGDDLLLSSISGGTDVCTAFVGGNPLLPVRAGEITCRYLGCAVEAFDDAGGSLVGEQGELVVTQPMPSMPVGFWNDPDGTRYRSAYFDRYPGVWCHGDWITIADDGSCVISGRSDATLNRGGVRVGTSDYYTVVEDLTEVADSLVVHLDDASDAVGELILFVAPAAGADIGEAERAQIATALRSELSPRHVPDVIEVVPAIPRTLSGKKLEVPVKRILGGADASTVVSPGALANPQALDAFVAYARSRRS